MANIVGSMAKKQNQGYYVPLYIQQKRKLLLPLFAWCRQCRCFDPSCISWSHAPVQEQLAWAGVAWLVRPAANTVYFTVPQWHPELRMLFSQRTWPSHLGLLAWGEVICRVSDSQIEILLSCARHLPTVESTGYIWVVMLRPWAVRWPDRQVLGALGGAEVETDWTWRLTAIARSDTEWRRCI